MKGSSTVSNGIRGFISRNKKYVIAAIIVYVLLTLLLMLSADGTLAPFRYQVL
jgi:hypothetical protein